MVDAGEIRGHENTWAVGALGLSPHPAVGALDIPAEIRKTREPLFLELLKWSEGAALLSSVSHLPASSRTIAGERVVR